MPQRVARRTRLARIVVVADPFDRHHPHVDVALFDLGVNSFPEVFDQPVQQFETALEVLQRLDGKKTVDALVGELVTEFDADRGEIEADVTELLNGLLEKRVLAL